jgi:hypothetical protein
LFPATRQLFSKINQHDRGMAQCDTKNITSLHVRCWRKKVTYWRVLCLYLILSGSGLLEGGGVDSKNSANGFFTFLSADFNSASLLNIPTEYNLMTIFCYCDLCKIVNIFVVFFLFFKNNLILSLCSFTFWDSNDFTYPWVLKLVHYRNTGQ